MSILAHGIDLVDSARLARSIERTGQPFLDRVFTAGDQRYCEFKKKSKLQSYAGRFAIKESVMKVLGTGWANGIAWTDIEVVNEDSGQPRLLLHGRCKEIAAEQGITEIMISISHIETHAIGSAIAIGERS